MGANDITKMHKNPGVLWVGVALPAENAELVIGADGTPDATASPNAKRLGMTDKGSIVSIGKTFTEEYVDEFKQPIERTLDQVSMSLKTRLVQVFDEDVLTTALAGVGTKVTKTGKLKYTIGEAPIVNVPIALVSPTKANAAKFFTSVIYSGRNVAPVDLEISRQTRAGIDLEFQGDAIPTRSKIDSIGQLVIENPS